VLLRRIRSRGVKRGYYILGLPESSGYSTSNQTGCWVVGLAVIEVDYGKFLRVARSPGVVNELKMTLRTGSLGRHF